LLDSKYTYILAAISIKVELKKFVTSEIAILKELIPFSEPDSSSLARTTIELEDIFANKKDVEIYEEIARNLNVLRREVANSKLAKLRLEDSNFLDNEESLKAVAECQKMKREERYSAASLLSQID
jgi:hypothetical protein